MRSLVPILALAACHAQPGPSGEAASCTAVADHVLALMPKTADPDHAKKVRDVMEHRCTADAWAAEVTGCMMDEQDLHARHHCQDKLTAEQRTAFTREVAALERPADEPRHPTIAGFPAECADYHNVMTQIQTCTGLPQQLRDQLQEGFDQQIASWMTIPADQRAMLANACKGGADQLRQFAGACAQMQSLP